MASTFTFTGAPTTVSPPAADLCRVSGYLTDHLGRVLKSHVLRVISKDSPIVTPNQGVIGESADIKSDKDGFILFDAYKGSELDLVFGSRAEQRRAVKIPNASTVNLLDLAFPYLVSVALAVTPTSIAVGATAAAVVTGTLSDGRTLPVTSFSTLASSNDAVAALAGSTLSGVAAGSSTISVSAVDAASLYLSPPTGFDNVFVDTRDKVFVRKDAPAVSLGGTVALTVT